MNLIQKEINSFLNNCKSKNDIKMVEWEFKGRRIKGRFKTYRPFNTYREIGAENGGNAI
ncbi:MAG: hypothetical protein ACP5H3_03590 [Candidatus Aenigmatarchaeota archaeon]